MGTLARNGLTEHSYLLAKIHFQMSIFSLKLRDNFLLKFDILIIWRLEKPQTTY